MKFRPLLILPVCLTAACANEDGVMLKAGIGRDSAGIVIVDNSTPAWNDQSGWRVGAEPLVAIGSVDGAQEYQLFRVQDALRLDDGTIAVANTGSSEVRFYDGAGKHVRSVGGRGNGPDEYQFLYMLARYGADSLVIWDPRLQRLTVLATDGTYGRTIKPDAGGGFVVYVGVFPDKSLLGTRTGGTYSAVEEVALTSSTRRAQWSVIQTSASLVELTPNGKIDEIGTFPDGEILTKSGGSTMGMPFTKRGAYAAAGELFYYGWGDKWEIQTYTRAGKLIRITRIAQENPALTQDTIDAYLAKRLARIQDPAARISVQKEVAELPLPEKMPAFSLFLVDAENNLWVNGYHELGGIQPPNWTIFDSDGRLLGSVEMPPGLAVHEIGTDYVLGVLRDEFDVERVVMYGLVKPPVR